MEDEAGAGERALRPVSQTFPLAPSAHMIHHNRSVSFSTRPDLLLLDGKLDTPPVSSAPS